MNTSIMPYRQHAGHPEPKFTPDKVTSVNERNTQREFAAHFSGASVKLVFAVSTDGPMPDSSNRRPTAVSEVRGRCEHSFFRRFEVGGVFVFQPSGQLREARRSPRSLCRKTSRPALLNSSWEHVHATRLRAVCRCVREVHAFASEIK